LSLNALESQSAAGNLSSSQKVLCVRWMGGHARAAVALAQASAGLFAEGRYKVILRTHVPYY